MDVSNLSLDMKFDAVTLVEVLEHIPPQQAQRFLQAVSWHMRPGAKLVVTVPHSNKPVQPKHYRHFSSQSLQELLGNGFRIDRIVPFGYRSKSTKLMTLLMGGLGDNFLITNRRLNSLLYRRFLSEYTAHVPERWCTQLLAVAEVT